MSKLQDKIKKDRKDRYAIIYYTGSQKKPPFKQSIKIFKSKTSALKFMTNIKKKKTIFYHRFITYSTKNSLPYMISDR
jgi:putative IMPACT (imprinted ancient) family translation regulator